MNYLFIIIIIIIIILFFYGKNKENNTNIIFWRENDDKNNDDKNNFNNYMDNDQIERTPYSHKSDYYSTYLTKCNINKKNNCINSRCIYKNIRDCQNDCKSGCRYCGQFGSYMCEMQ